LTGSELSIEKPQFAFFLLQVNDLADENRTFSLSANDLVRINPNTKSCPVFRTRQDAELTAKLYRAVPVLVNEATGQDGWHVSFLRMFDMSNDSTYFHTRVDLDNKGLNLDRNRFVNDVLYLPLYEGKFIAQFDHRHATLREGSTVQGNKADLTTNDEHQNPHFLIKTRYWVEESTIPKKLGDISWKRKWFVSFRRITRAVDRRSTRFSISPYAGYADTSALLLPQKKSTLIGCLVASMNSFVVDYISRQKISGIHLDFYNVEQLPVLPPDRYTPDLLRFIVPRVLELTYTAWDLQPFANDVWAEVREMGRKGEGERGCTPLQAALLQQWKANQRVVAPSLAHPVTPSPPHTTDFPRPPFTWDAARRSQLRAELDALYARLYGLSREELAYILETFPIVKRKDEAQYGEYRTKRMILEKYEETEPLAR
jgi:hypothetical protein